MTEDSAYSLGLLEADEHLHPAMALRACEDIDAKDPLEQGVIADLAEVQEGAAAPRRRRERSARRERGRRRRHGRTARRRRRGEGMVRLPRGSCPTFPCRYRLLRARRPALLSLVLQRFERFRLVLDAVLFLLAAWLLVDAASRPEGSRFRARGLGAEAVREVLLEGQRVGDERAEEAPAGVGDAMVP